jgi:hypothetical protein
MTQGIPAVLALWSAPRSRSTAFLRMMAERGDYTVLHEPFSQRADFGEYRVGGTVARTEPELIAAITALAGFVPVFFKDTTDFHYPYLLRDARFLGGATHTFIIREPAAVIASHFALNPRLDRDEVGFERLAEIFDAVAERTGRAPVVIDSDDLVHRPAATIRAYCAAVGIPYLARALAWQPGVRTDWERTARWHRSTAESAGFVPVDRAHPDGVDTNPVLAGYLRHHLPYYQRLRAARLPVDGASEAVGRSP